MNRIIVLGNSGAGKSTFCIQMADILKMDFLHLDKIVYKHDWVQIEYEEVERQINEFLLKDRWIVDGNFLNKIQSRFEKCDTIYFLDINRFTCFFSVIKRYFKYKGKNRSSRNEMCDEKLTISYLMWVMFGFYKTSRKKIIKMCKDQTKEVIIFKNRRQIKKYLKEKTI